MIIEVEQKFAFGELVTLKVLVNSPTSLDSSKPQVFSVEIARAEWEDDHQPVMRYFCRGVTHSWIESRVHCQPALQNGMFLFSESELVPYPVEVNP